LAVRRCPLRVGPWAFAPSSETVTFARLSGDTPYLDAPSLAADPVNLAFLTGKGWADMQKAKKLSDVDVRTYDARFVPGGLAPMADMSEHQLLKQVIKETYERNAIVGVVCYGPVSPLNVKLSDGSYLLAGKNLSYGRRGRELREAGRALPPRVCPDQAGRNLPQDRAVATFQHCGRESRHRPNSASAKGVAEKMIKLLEAA